MQCACTRSRKACTKSSSQLMALVGCSKSLWPPPSKADSSNCTHLSSKVRLEVTRDCISAVFVGKPPKNPGDLMAFGPPGLSLRREYSLQGGDACIRPTWPEKQSRIKQSKTSSERTSNGESCRISTGSTGRRKASKAAHSGQVAPQQTSTKMRAPEAAALDTTRASAETGSETGEEIEGGKGNPHPRRMAED